MSAGTPGRIAGTTETKLILVVDDDPVSCRTLQRLLETKKEFRVLTCRSGADALELVRRQAPDLMLVDYAMPGMSGVDLIRALAEGGRDVPSILVTGHPDVDDVLRLQKQGTIDFVVAKPWRNDHLLHVVEQALRLQAMNDAVGRLRSLRETWSGSKR